MAVSLLPVKWNPGQFPCSFIQFSEGARTTIVRWKAGRQEPSTLDLDMYMMWGTPKKHEARSVPIISFTAISEGEQSLNTAEICLVMWDSMVC